MLEKWDPDGDYYGLPVHFIWDSLQYKIINTENILVNEP